MYRINNIAGFTFDVFVRCLKAKFTIDELEDNLLNVDIERIKDLWDDIQPITVEEGLKEKNLEKRRAIFSCLKPEEYLTSVGTVIDQQTLTKKQIRWDKNNNPYEHVFEDEYTLYRLDKLEVNSWNIPQAIKCRCTTTNREYVIFVPTWVVKDAISAIAWTLRIPSSITINNRTIYTEKIHIDKIVRQGDVLVIKWKQECTPSDILRPLTKDEYMELITTET